MYIKKIILVGLFMGSQLLDGKSLSFQHHDWQVVCDNTYTCRIAGYSSDEEEENRISVLLTRKAGARTKTTAKIQLAMYDESDEKLFKKFPSVFKLEMLINGKSYGLVSMKNSDSIASLSEKQTDALLASLRQSSDIVWKYKKYQWRLSDEGSTAVLLKADEFQKRLHTRTAFYKKGIQSEKNVLQPKAVPVIYAQTVEDDKALTIKDKAYIEKLTDGLRGEDCFDADYDADFTFYALSPSQLVATKLAWRAAYNSSYCSWVINKKEPFNPQDAIEGDYYVNEKKMGIVSNNQKWRGLGDCWSYEEYVWTGKTFEQSSVGSTGLCRLIAGGGAWNLPTFVSKVTVK